MVGDMDQVRAAVKVARETTELREFARPAPQSDTGLLRVNATGVGGSDPELYRMEKNTPAIMGHEIVGTVEEAGDIFTTRWNLKPGDRIALHEYQPCHHCEHCLGGNHRLCWRTDIFGIGKPQRYGQMDCLVEPHLFGGYAQYAFLPSQILFHRLPDSIPAHLATLAMPLGNGWQWAVLEGGAGPGKTVVVFGPGQQGLGCVLAAREAGASRVILVGKGRRDRARLDLALRLGADDVLDADDGDTQERLLRMTSGRGVDVVVDTTGDPDGEIARMAIAIAAPFAQLSLNGLDQAVPVRALKSKSLTVRAPRGRTWRAVDLALKTMASQRWPLEDMCTHRFSLAETHLAILATAGREIADAVHVVVEPWK
jgi:threonine dehydrogenase-like Zn-dependent dehydrogenase